MNLRGWGAERVGDFAGCKERLVWFKLKIPARRSCHPGPRPSAGRAPSLPWTVGAPRPRGRPQGWAGG